MATSPRRVCWDACTWIALIQEEKIIEGGGNTPRSLSVGGQV
jgi:hypothetical protein